VTVDLAN